jgi:hypothetical protein
MQMVRWQTRFIVAAVSLTVALAASAGASAGEDNHRATEAVLREVEASPKKDVAAEMIGRSKNALARAAKLREGGQEAHARLADALAKTWADAARETVRAAAVEERAEASRRSATDAGIIAERERALLEEGIAQSGRLRAQLDAIEREAKEQPARTSAAATAGSDSGRKPKPEPPPPAARPDGGTR